jgi:2-amino-4-hydroxy-6-hydroxymethyldihydropteridine diphosphokinase
LETVYIGLGANISGPAGSPEATLAAAAASLERLGRVRARSSLYSTAPVGFADQPRFVNAVVALETEMQPRELLVALLAIEREFGRDRKAEVRNGPRPLDLDILLYGARQVSEPGLEIPHPRLSERAFVLAPLAEMDATDPRSGRTARELHAALGADPDAAVRIESGEWGAEGQE